MKKLVLSFIFIVLVSRPDIGIGGDVAVIVNKENPVSDVSLSRLVRIFKQETRFWENGTKIHLILQETGALEKQIVLNKIYRMDEQGLKKYWLTKIFRGEISSFPRTLGSNEAVIRFVSEVPDAIGFIDASRVDDRVKVLRIKGKQSGEAGYVLRDR